MVKSIDYLDRFKDIIEELSLKHGVPVNTVVDIINHFFLTLKKFITDPRMPTIKISMWGTFKPTVGKINWSIGQTLYHMSMDRGNRELMFKKIRIIQRIKERLLQEKAGIHTWKLWKNKTVEELETESKE